MEDGRLAVTIRRDDWKFVTFPPGRSAELRLTLDKIDAKVQQLIHGHDLQFRRHLGGSVHVSVTKGFDCVDFCYFFVSDGKEEKNQQNAVWRCV